MRSTRLRKFALAVAATALVLTPAGAAYAGSGPAPAPAGKGDRAAATAPTAQGNPESKRAQAAGVCDDAYQIGATAHIKRSGATVASVKQFYSPSCKENYGYLWVWDSFHTTAKPYDVTLGVFSYDQDAVLGKISHANTKQQEFWTQGTDTAEDCTAAVGTLRAEGAPLPNQAASEKRC
ncbi:hypothetical protein O7599_24165 [Streptomyces sp. WMMC500]|uniref:hypothetical protein n=1 Tax=Streptomyces sp. WMMC500 TaxID=3015154 RepID=UPI00248AD09A|nr:hypothetical protein [Streptomyces sp. WMMC500]WBB58705.1 hypothetical protein O7599_24165 [Streptomyces sp. WMMC500]